MKSNNLLYNRLPELQTERLTIRLLEPYEAPFMKQFRIENKEYLIPWEPKRRPEFYTDTFWRTQLLAMQHDFRAGNSVCFSILNKEQNQVLGICNYTNIVRGTFQSCHLGYALAQKHQGQGLMEEALSSTVGYIFAEIGLHRIMANYLPHNNRSAKLLNRLGFEEEGRAREYLMINGKWEDHVLTSLINTRSN